MRLSDPVRPRITAQVSAGEVALLRRPIFKVPLESVERRLYEFIHDQGHLHSQGYRQVYESQKADELSRRVTQGGGQGFDALGPKTAAGKSTAAMYATHTRRSCTFRRSAASRVQGRL